MGASAAARPAPGPARDAASDPAAAIPAAAPWLRLDWDGRRATVAGTAHALVGGGWDPDGGDARTAEGVFAEWRWDGAALEARTDVYGFGPLFYAVRGTTLWLSSSVPALLAAGAPAALDDGALAVFLRTGVFLADTTAFAAVRAAPPGLALRWAEGVLTLGGGRPTAAPVAVGREEAVARYAELFTAAMARRPVEPARTVVPLTGGRDSRHILLELCAAGRPPARAVTVGPTGDRISEDVRVARAIAEAAGVAHETLLPRPHRHADELEKNARTNFLALEHSWVLNVDGWLARHGGPRPVLYDGIGGDTLSEAKYMNAHRLDLLRRAGVAEYVEEELGGEHHLPALLTPAAYRRFSRGLAAERLAAELATHLDAPNPVGSYRFWNRTRRTVAAAPFGVLAARAEVRAPYLDPPLVAFLSGLPGELVVDRTFHSAAIALAHPRFEHVGYQRPVPRAPVRPAYARRWTGDVARWLVATRPAAGGSPRLLRPAAYLGRVALGWLSEARARSAMGPTPAVTYLRQLERLADTGAGIAAGT